MNPVTVKFFTQSALTAVDSALKQFFDHKPAADFSEQDRQNVSSLLTIAVDYLNRAVQDIGE